jgi:hypothetical protein
VLITNNRALKMGAIDSYSIYWAIVVGRPPDPMARKYEILFLNYLIPLGALLPKQGDMVETKIAAG